jgi:hypothetical protein
MAWLESLAAKHGAKAEELVTDPSARREKPPEWVEQARAMGETQPVVIEPEDLETAPFQEPEPLEPSADETGIWLRELSEKEETGEGEPETSFLAESVEVEFKESAADVEDWLSKPENVPPKPEEPEVVSAPQESAPGEPSDLPDWLRGLDEEQKWPSATAASDELPAWLQGEPEPPARPEPTVPTDWHPVESEPESQRAGELGLEPELPAQPASEQELPGWLASAPEEPQREPYAEPEIGAEPQPEPQPQMEAEPYAAIEPQPPVEPELEMQPETEIPGEPVSEPVIEMEPEAELEAGPLGQLEPEPEMDVRAEAEPETGVWGQQPAEPGPEIPAELRPEPEPEPVPQPLPTEPSVARKVSARPAAPRRQPGVLAPIDDPELVSAHSEMNRGDIPAALEHYGRLIKKGRWLEEIIRDLREALYRYPVEVTIWQTLGDAYMRENRLQEALDSYTKAEELLR